VRQEEEEGEDREGNGSRQVPPDQLPALTRGLEGDMDGAAEDGAFLEEELLQSSQMEEDSEEEEFGMDWGAEESAPQVGAQPAVARQAHTHAHTHTYTHTTHVYPSFKL